MSEITQPTTRRSRRRVAVATALAAAVAVPGVAHADHGRDDEPRLTGRAVLPVATYAAGPVSGQFVIPGPGVRNGITFPLESQPVEGFSGIVEGRTDGEILAMADNGFGTKANSPDFHIRAYHLQPDFETADGGSGAVAVADYIEFSDPDDHIPFPIRYEGTADRILTGADIDPESIQRDRRGDLWVGDEFGPWLLHFDAAGRLLEEPIKMPDGLVALTNPLADPDGVATTPPLQPITVSNSRGIEAMALTPNGRSLYVVLEGAVIGAPDATSRRIYEFDLHRREWTRVAADYGTDVAGHFVADAQALDSHRLLVVERDGAAAAVRKVYEVDLRDARDGGLLPKTMVVDLAAIPDPDLISLPAIHPGDVGIGPSFRVMCESIEALRIVSKRELLLGCDNNFPNVGRNPGLADDNELITVAVPRL
ncbi:MAG TPA: esterase-like activity of phytase family protein [Ilumatobacteraceae bacterium]|nr:esterase-like activity of phytase family protein [Ilumatobacteraceae bacterium]